MANWDDKLVAKSPLLGNVSTRPGKDSFAIMVHAQTIELYYNRLRPKSRLGEQTARKIDQ